MLKVELQELFIIGAVKTADKKRCDIGILGYMGTRILIDILIPFD